MSIVCREIREVSERNDDGDEWRLQERSEARRRKKKKEKKKIMIK